MNTSSSNSKIYINGPFNYIKLEGNDKNIHVFYDVHNPLYNQSECNNDDSIDINKYLSKLFKTTDKNIDFFFEIYPNDKLTKGDENKKYISKVADFFLNQKNKLKKNIKFHYIDVRYFFYYREINNNFDIFFNNFFPDCFNNDNSIDIKIESFNYYINILNNTNDFFYKILDIYNSLQKKNIPYKKVNLEKLVFIDKNTKIKPNTDESLEIQHNSIIQILTKLLKKHTNNNTKKIIDMLLKEYFTDNIISIIKQISELVNIINNYLLYLKENNNNNNVNIFKNFDNIFYVSFINSIDDEYDIKNEINKKITNIDYAIVSTMSFLQDIYFIKRFIEKNYITNAITYTGGAHSNVMVYILVKYFNFKITECYYVNKNLLKNDSIEEINNEVLKVKHPIYLSQYFFQKKYGKQCVSINPI
jgi:hypothetical protein